MRVEEGVHSDPSLSAPYESAGALPAAWLAVDSEVARHIDRRSRECLAAYRENPLLVTEHANIERSTAQGGYGRRQIFELVQNAADALIDLPGGRIHILLTDSTLYCANEGIPIDAEGIDAIISSHLSMKRGSEIGRFGLGFKSVLGVCDRPEVYSRFGSFGFDPGKAAERIREVVADAARLPILRIAMPLDPAEAAASDTVLASLMSWATTIIKLPRNRQRSTWLSNDVSDFPPEFLLFSPHVGCLTLEDATRGIRREIRVQVTGDRIHLEEGKHTSVWKVFPDKTRIVASGQTGCRRARGS